jgi:hypothetical protein
MSSFADPYRRTTQVELGCKLTYLSDLKDSINWDAFDDPENEEATEVDAEIVTLPISASSIALECLTNLDIVSNGLFLTNRFSIPEFDFSPGYVQILSDLLVSESYFGYLDTNEVLQVVSLDVEAGTGPVFTSSDIVDLGPIGVGQLPGEAVTVSYSTLRLKEDIEVTDPEETTEEEQQEEEVKELAKLNWELQETIGAESFVNIDWTLGDNPTPRSSTYRFIPRTTVVTEYDDWDRMTKRTTITYTIGATLNTTYYTDVAEAGNQAFGASWASSPQEITEVEIPEYAVAAYGKEKPENYDEVKSSITTKTEPRMATLGAAGISTKSADGNSVGFAGGTGVTEIIKSTYETGTKVVAGGFVPVTRRATNKTLAYGYTQQGQQAFATRREKGLSVLYSDAFILVDAGTETITNTGREVTLQSRPSSADRSNAAYNDNTNGANGSAGGDTVTTASATASASSDWRTESEAQIELAVGSAAAQRRIEFSLPYAPDDRFIKTSSDPLKYTSVRSDAASKATTYGRVQNRLLLGNRNGINLQVSPERLPAAPFEPLYVEANGLTAQYRANGTSWAFDGNGIVASVDALFWTAVGGTGTFWFPVAPGITTLPATPAIVDGTITPTTVVLPYNETTIYNGILRTRLDVAKFDYSLEGLTVLPDITTKIKIVAARIYKVEVPSASITLETAAPSIGTSAVVRCPAAGINMATSVPSISITGTAVACPAIDISLSILTPSISITGIAIGCPVIDISISPSTPVIST